MAADTLEMSKLNGRPKMLEMIAAGVVAHALYHKAAAVVHDENEIHHVKVAKVTTSLNQSVDWQFVVCNPCKE